MVLAVVMVVQQQGKMATTAAVLEIQATPVVEVRKALEELPVETGAARKQELPDKADKVIIVVALVVAVGLVVVEVATAVAVADPTMLIPYCVPILPIPAEHAKVMELLLSIMFLPSARATGFLFS